MDLIINLLALVGAGAIIKKVYDLIKFLMQGIYM